MHRRQTYTADGTLLSEIDVARDCANGPHEMRACMRDDLVQTMVNALPHGTVRFSATVCSVDPHPTGVIRMFTCGRNLDFGDSSPFQIALSRHVES